VCFIRGVGAQKHQRKGKGEKRKPTALVKRGVEPRG